MLFRSIYCGVRKSVALPPAVIVCVRAHLLRGSGRGERKRSHFPTFQAVAYKLGAKGAVEIIHARAPCLFILALLLTTAASRDARCLEQSFLAIFFLFSSFFFRARVDGAAVRIVDGFDRHP